MDDTLRITQAYALVGQFMHAWAVLENRLSTSITKLTGVESAIEGAILTTNMAARDKLNAVRTLLLFHKPSRPDWDAEVKKMVERIGDRVADRNLLAHNAFSAAPKGGVVLHLVKAKGAFSIPDVTWSVDTVSRKICMMDALGDQLASLVAEAQAPRTAFLQRRRKAWQTNALGLLMTRPQSDPGSARSTDA